MPNSSDSRDRDYNDKAEFSPSTPLDSSELSFPTAFFYAVNDLWVQELGFQLAFLYSMIISLSSRDGYCFMQDKTFAKRMRMSVGTIERWMKKLEEKGFIYRNTFQSRQGKKRHLVPKSHFSDYWKRFLNRPCVPDDVKKDYLKRMFATQPTEKIDSVIEESSNINPQTQPPNGPPPKTVGSYATPTDEGSILLRNSNSKEQRQTDGQAGSVAAVSFEDKIKKELSIMKITGERTSMALEYYKRHKELVDKKKNPMGWIVQGTKQGWIADVVAKEKNEPPKTPAKKPPPPPPPRILSLAQRGRVAEVVKKFKELVEEEHINIQMSVDGFNWEASNAPGKFFQSYQKPGTLKLLKTLAFNMHQEEGLNFILKVLSEDSYADL